jgi:hypothetical protein
LPFRLVQVHCGTNHQMMDSKAMAQPRGATKVALILGGVFLLLAENAVADCQSIANAAKRLGCYDKQPATALASSPIIQLKISLTGSNPPAFHGETNLPDGSMIQYELRGDVPGCNGECGLGSGVFVSHGAFALFRQHRRVRNSALRG